MSLQDSDKAAAAVAKAPRVTLDDIKNNIVAEYSFTADKALTGVPLPRAARLDILTICILVLNNGFTVIGKSAPAAPENFDADLGRKFAKEDAMRQCWPLMGYALREKLATTDKAQAAIAASEKQLADLPAAKR